jgi:hypothetical protein
MANPTADELVERAFGRVGELNAEFPSTRGTMWRRVGYRQRQLFAIAAQANSDRFGVCASAPLQTVSGSRVADLNDFVSPVPTPELIDRVDILDAGTSGYAVGKEVTLVQALDQQAGFVPRAMLRDRILIGVGTDLDLVTSVRIYYAKLPELFTEADQTKVTELEAPWDVLLELDLVLWLLDKATGLAPDKLAQAVAGFQSEQAKLERDFLVHVAAYAPHINRFLPSRLAGVGGR